MISGWGENLTKNINSINNSIDSDRAGKKRGTGNREQFVLRAFRELNCIP